MNRSTVLQVQSILVRHLDDRVVGDGGVAKDSNDARADVNAVLLIDEIFDAGGIGDGAVLTDARVLVDDGIGDSAALTDADGDTTRSNHFRLLLVRLVVVRADDHGMLDGAASTNLRAKTNDGVLHGAIRKRATVGDDSILNMALVNLRGGKVTRRGVDGRSGVVELKLRRILGERKVRFEERLDGTDVFPVIVEEVCLHMVAVRRSLGDDLTTKVIVLGVILVEEVQKGLLLEHVNAHRGDVGRRLGRILVEPEDGGVHLHCLERFAGGLLCELIDAAGLIDLHQAEIRSTLIVHGETTDGDISVHLTVTLDESHVVHAVKVITGEDDDVVNILVLDVLKQPRVLANGVGGALEPLLTTQTWCLSGGEHLHEASAAVHDAVTEVVRAREVSVEGHRVELGEDVHLGDARVEAVGHGHVDQAIGAADGHSGLSAGLGERIETSSRATTKDHRSDRLGVGDGRVALVFLRSDSGGLDGEAGVGAGHLGTVDGEKGGNSRGRKNVTTVHRVQKRVRGAANTARKEYERSEMLDTYRVAVILVPLR
jgi:hypothetical protein